MNTVQVKLGKPSKFYVNNKRIDLNTAFGMYQKGVPFTNYLDTIPDEIYREILQLTFHPNTEIPKYSVINSDDQRIEQYMNKKGELHRVGGPAKIIDDGEHIKELWYKNGQLHRVGAPAVLTIDQDGKKLSEKWYKKGELHRDGDKPAVTVHHWYNDSKRGETWYKHGKRHRDGDKPADILYTEDSQIYWQTWAQKGKEHRNGDKPSHISKYVDTFTNPGITRLIPKERRWVKNGKLQRGHGKPTIEKWEYPPDSSNIIGSVYDNLVYFENN